MKKLLFLVAVAGLISFAACKSGENKNDAKTDSTAVQQAPVDTTHAATVDTTKKVK